MAIKDRVKAVKDRICGRKLETGDVVRVEEGGNWNGWDHPVGGKGRWAIYVGTKGDKAIVRPLGADGTAEKPTPVSRVMHLDDAITEIAIADYKSRRLNNGASNGTKNGRN